MILNLLDKLGTVVVFLLNERATLVRKIADLEKALAEEKAKPPVGQEELDAANQKAAEAEARAVAAEQAKVSIETAFEAYKAEDVAEDSEAATKTEGLIAAIEAAIQPPVETPPADNPSVVDPAQ